MNALLITVAIIVALFVLVCVLAGIAAIWSRIRYPHGYETSPQQIRAELQKILDGVDPRAIDDFTSVGPLKDARLEAIRQRVAQLGVEFPPESKGQYCNSKGIEVIRGYVRELEHEIAA
jgi:hypothetical protein